uniref:Uncharacterized protein n=1 Tax=Meloidogyne javanica TaxID=6303 RepID=A0A915MBB8_MELJA
TSYGQHMDLEEFEDKNDGGDNVDNEWLIDDDQMNDETGQQQQRVQTNEGILLEEWQQLG